MTDKCIWKYESAQFAGGPFYSTSCGEYTVDVEDMEDTCPYCNKFIYYQDDEDE